MSDDFDMPSDSPKSHKELARERAKIIRREAYQKAKERKKNDPREQQRKLDAKAKRREAYQKLKEKKRSETRALKSEQDKNLEKSLRRASELKDENVSLAPVISLEQHRLRRQKSLQ